MQLGAYLQRTIFQQIDELYEQEHIIEENQIESKNNRRLFQQLKKQLRRILYNKQNIYLRENLINLHNSKFLEGFAEDLSPTVQQCFYFFSQALANARSLKILDISGMDIHPLLAIEIGIGLQHNTSLRELHMGSCKMNSFSLQYIFSSLTNHKNLQLLNIFNNQGFTIDLVNDLNQFLFQGKNNLKKLKLTHCNISTTGLSYLFRNIKSSKSIRQLDVSMMYFNTEVLTSLGIALEEYKGKEVLESLNISDCSIRDSGLQTLTQRLSWNIRKINIQELILRSNQITQAGVQYLESLLKEINQLKKLDLSYNKIEEFNCLELHSRKMYEVHLVKNCISTFSNYFFMNTLVVNLSNNNIQSKGSFQLSSILRQNPLWIELNLTSNCIQSEGFNSIIFGLRDNTMLKKLIVANNQLDGESIICYMINHEQVQFEYLDLSHNQIRIELIYELLNNIKNGMLKSLKCSYLLGDKPSDSVNFNIFESSATIKTFQLASFNLRELDFHGNKNIFSTISLSLSTFYNKIEKLNISNCTPITDSDIEQLCLFLRKSTMIRELNLSNLNLGNLKSETMKILSDAVSLSNLRCLNFSRTKLYKNIKKLLKYNNSSTNFKLESLDLSFNCLEGKHLGHIEKILKRFRNLQEINLSHNWLNFECLNAINRALLDNESIKKINLSYQKFSADDLLILSQTLQSEGLKELDLSNNMYTTKTKTYFKQCSTLRQEQLTFQHIYFDEFYFQSLLTIIEKQKRNLKKISLEACFFKTGQYTKFIHELQKCKKLEFFEFIYNPNIDIDLRDQIEYISAFRTKYLKFEQVNLPENFIQGISESLGQNKSYLLSIDLRQIKFEQNSFNTLCQGIAQNTILRELILNNCYLGLLDLTMLGIMIRQNNSISILELANNEITTLNKTIQGLKGEVSFSSLGKLNLSGNQLQDESLAQLFVPYQTKTKYLTVSTLDLTNCQMNNQILQCILDAQIEYKNNYSLANLISLCMANNNLDQQSGLILKDIIVNCPYLQEISFPKNDLASQGSLEILKGVLQSQSVKTLDLSYNLITDTMVETIASEFLNNQLKSLQFILLRGNTFTQKAQRKLVEIIAFQKRLFIDYVWSKLYDLDGEQILIQYTKLGQSYYLQQHSMPYFVKEIIITNAYLTDKFTELLSKYYPLLSFIEFIDISDNPYITMYGKVYLFIHIFDQCYAKHNLKALYIGESQETRKIYDDGLLRYLLLKFRNFLYPPNMKIPCKQANSQAELFRTNVEKGQSYASTIIGRLCGSWLLHKINQLMKYLDKIEPPQFIVSTLFLGKFRKNNLQIKTMVVILGISSIFICLSQFYKLIFYQTLNYDDLQKDFNQICKDHVSCSNFNNYLIDQDYIYLACQFILILFVECCQLGIGVFLRRKIQPAFQIIHPNLLKYYKSSFPHTQEILRMIFSIIWKLSSLPERLLLYYLATFRYTEVRGEKYRLKASNLAIFFLVIVRVCKFLLLLLYNNFTFLRMKPNDDVAKFLQLLQKSIHYEGYFVISETLINLCPQQGYQFTKSIVINEEIFVSTVTIFVIEISTSISFGILYNEYTNLIDKQFQGYDPLGMFQVWILIAFFKSILAIVVILFRIFTVRPAVVKQDAFNQGLTLKRFAENRNKFVPSSHMKIDSSLNYQVRSEKEVKKETKIIQTDQGFNQMNQSLRNNEMEKIVEEDDDIKEEEDVENEDQNENDNDNYNDNEYGENDNNRRNDSLIDDELSPLK